MEFRVAIDAFLIARFADVLAFLTVAIESIVADAFGKLDTFSDACGVLVTNFVVGRIDFTVVLFAIAIAVTVGSSTSVLFVLLLPFTNCWRS